MFNWFRKDEPSIRPEVKQMKGPFWDAFGQALQAAIRDRFHPLHSGYLHQLHGSLSNALDNELGPPYVLFLASMDSFRDNVQNLQTLLFEALQRDLADWLKKVDVMGHRKQVDIDMKHVVFDLCEQLYNDGKKLAETHSDEIDRAEVAWHASRPEKSADRSLTRKK